MVPIPVGDDNPTLRTAWATYFILALTFASWFFIQGAGLNVEVLARTVCNYGMVPGELTGLARLGTAVPLDRFHVCVVDHDAINVLTPLFSIFLHGGWLHLLGNCLFLWVFGNNVEDSMGRRRFLFFYLLSGMAAAVAQIAIEPASPAPMVGASGAIAGVLGAYLVLYPRARVKVFIPPIPWVFRIPAWAELLVWFGYQVLAGLPQLAFGKSVSDGVAVWAHIGGFGAGVVLAKLFENPVLKSQRRVLERRSAR